MSFVFLQILEYYYEAFVSILKGLALFFLFTQSTLAIGVEKDPEQIAIQLWSGWDKAKLLLQHEIECNIIISRFKFSEEKCFWFTPFLWCFEGLNGEPHKWASQKFNNNNL